MHSEKLLPDRHESLALAGALTDLSASAQDVVAEFCDAGGHNIPVTPSAGPLVGPLPLALRPLDKLLSLEGLPVSATDAAKPTCQGRPRLATGRREGGRDGGGEGGGAGD